MINQEEINTIKQNVDLISLVKSKGIKLRKNGKGYKGCCPFHEETKPSFSVNPEQNLWNCFGCDKVSRISINDGHLFRLCDVFTAGKKLILRLRLRFVGFKGMGVAQA